MNPKSWTFPLTGMIAGILVGVAIANKYSHLLKPIGSSNICFRTQIGTIKL